MQRAAVDLIADRKHKLSGHICRMEENRLIMKVMLGWAWWKAIGLVEDQQGGGPTTVWT